MTVLVTGATGFVGSAVVRKLLADQRSVAVLARPNSNRSNLDGLDIEVREGDLTDTDSLKKALRGCDALFHIAADYRLWTKNPQELYRINVDGTRALMHAAIDANVRRIVYTSSVATLGVFSDGRVSDEETPVSLDNMVGHYKRSKYLAERVVDELVQSAQLPAVIVNPSTPVGPRDIKPTPTGRLIYDALNEKIPAFVDTGLNIAHVDDVATGHLLALTKGRIGRRYILGGEDLSLKEILTMVADYCGHQPPTIKLPRQIIYPVAWVSQAWAYLTNGPEPRATVDGLKMSRKKMFFSSARAIDELGYDCRPAEIAIREAIDWFKENRALMTRS
ncbi:MAG: hopanoid-associated sugar epimerase [Gammaproteobacteria bacterium]